MITTLTTKTTAIEAHIILGRLQAEGIPAFIAFEHHIWANWMLSNALGGVRVQVLSSRIKDANVVISNIENGEFQKYLEAETGCLEKEHCPSCNSNAVKNIIWPWKIAFLSLFIFTVPIPYVQNQMKCVECNHVWKTHKRTYSVSVMIFTIFLFGTLLLIGLALWFFWCRLNCSVARFI
ncbi:MAG: DUF2007 domain-containing protein [gamma proteobacterium symbiont of Taylorina sp.]|nr:DUF2007 domain-containing protein [gamma proteobacterium symbiont of Taylorina sp.]